MTTHYSDENFEAEETHPDQGLATDAEVESILNPPAEEALPLPADFDLDSWFSGVTETVRTCNIYGRSDLIGTLDSLEARYGIAELAANDPEASVEEANEVEVLQRQILEIQQQFVDSGVTFHFRGLSETARKRIDKQWRNHEDLHGLDKGERAVYLTTRQMVEALVQPEGVTFEHLVAFRERSEAQFRKMMVTYQRACSLAPQVTPPFSPGSSASRRTPRR